MICHENSENSLFSRKCAYDFIFCRPQRPNTRGQDREKWKENGSFLDFNTPKRGQINDNEYDRYVIVAIQKVQQIFLCIFIVHVLSIHGSKCCCRFGDEFSMGIKGSSRDSSLGLIPVEAMSGIIYAQI